MSIGCQRKVTTQLREVRSHKGSQVRYDSYESTSLVGILEKILVVGEHLTTLKIMTSVVVSRVTNSISRHWGLLDKI